MAEMQTGTSFAGPAAEQPSRRERWMSEGKEKVEKVGGDLRSKAFAKADQRKEKLSQSFDRLARNLDEFKEGLQGPEAKVADAAAGYLRKAQGLIDRHSTDELANRAVSELKQRPAAVIAGCFALGFVGIRLLKS